MTEKVPRKREIKTLTGDDEAAFIESLNTSTTTYDIFRVLKKIAYRYGYSYFIFMRLPENREAKLSDVAIVTNWDPELIKAYDAKLSLSTSPIIERLYDSILPFNWEIGQQIGSVDCENQSYADELFSNFGMLSGLYLSVSDRNGKRGAFGLSGTRGEPDKNEIKSLLYLASNAFEKLSGIEEEVHSVKVKLTDRERECVYWTAAGKTSSEVAQILNISENTINHYLSTAANKLDTVNKAHTVAKALRLGILN